MEIVLALNFSQGISSPVHQFEVSHVLSDSSFRPQRATSTLSKIGTLECLGVLTAETSIAFATKLSPNPRTSPFMLPSQPGYVLQTSVGEKQDLRVFIAKDDQLLEVYQCMRDEVDKNRLVEFCLWRGTSLPMFCW
jgi:hypothetical protein